MNTFFKGDFILVLFSLGCSQTYSLKRNVDESPAIGGGSDQPGKLLPVTKLIIKLQDNSFLLQEELGVGTLKRCADVFRCSAFSIC